MRDYERMKALYLPFIFHPFASLILIFSIRKDSHCGLKSLQIYSFRFWMLLRDRRKNRKAISRVAPMTILNATRRHRRIYNVWSRWRTKGDKVQTRARLPTDARHMQKRSNVCVYMCTLRVYCCMRMQIYLDIKSSSLFKLFNRATDLKNI